MTPREALARALAGEGEPHGVWAGTRKSKATDDERTPRERPDADRDRPGNEPTRKDRS